MLPPRLERRFAASLLNVLRSKAPLLEISASTAKIVMATVYGRLDGFSTYRDSRNSSSLEEQHAQLSGSKTLYVGNLSFYTSEEQIHELFRQVGPVRRIIMGLDVCLMFVHAALTDSRRPGLGAET